MDIEEIARIVLDSANHIHNDLGPGLPAAAYRACLAYELRKRELQVDLDLSLPVFYDGQKIDAGLRLDTLVENSIIVENLCVDELLPLHEARLLTFLKLADCRVGFLLNWNVRFIKDGIKRLVHRSKETGISRSRR